MEFAVTEIAVLEQVEPTKTEKAWNELGELQLVAIGGGNADVIWA